MARQDILERVKIHTDQQIHASNVTKGLTAKQNAVQNSIMGGSLLSSSGSYTALDLDDIEDRGWADGNVLSLSSKMMDANRKGDTELANDYRKMLRSLGKNAFEAKNITEEEYKKYNEFEIDLWMNSGPNINQKEFEEFGTLIKYMTEDQWMPDFTLQTGVMGDFMDRTATKFGAAAATTGAYTAVASAATLGAGFISISNIKCSIIWFCCISYCRGFRCYFSIYGF
jgi:hypothetical protein